MSTLNKKTLALALVAGLGIAANASAFTVTTNGDTAPVLVATADITSAATVIGANEDFEITLTGSDSILGRTTGFSVRLELSNGARFASTFEASDVTIGTAGNNPLFPGTPAGSEWTASIAAGGANQDFVVLSINPPSTIPVPGLVAGELLHLDAANAVVSPDGVTGTELTNLTYLQTPDREILVNVIFRDPVSGNVIAGTTGPTPPRAILRSGNPLTLSCDASTADEPDERIDVGVTVAQDSKTFFSSTGEIGLADNGIFNAGSVTAEITGGFTSFAYQATDDFVTTVTGSFAAFDQAGADIFLATDPTCATPLVSATLNAANTVATFVYDGGDLAPNFSAAGFDVSLCFEVPGGNDMIIAASDVVVRTSFERGAFEFDGPSCSLLPLLYNGSIVKVATFNPAANATAQSFIRITNPSTTPGRVTIEAWDDMGVKAPNVTFTLSAGRTDMINSDVLEAGGNTTRGQAITGLGDGTGKWRFLVTGEFAGMRVQSLNRNNTDGTVTNLTDYDTNSEQNKNLFFGALSTYEGSDPN